MRLGNMQRLSRSGAPPQLPGLFGFMVSVGATMVGLLLTGLLAPLLGGPFFLFALAAVALSALYCGLGAGLLATLLAGGGFCFFFFPPIGSFHVQDTRDVLRLVIFLGVSALMSGVGSSLRQSLMRTRTRLAERERMDQELRNAHERTAELLESTSDAFFSVDRRFHFTYLNPPAERVLGRKREALMGRSLWAEFPEVVGSSFQQEYQRAMDMGRPTQFVEFYAPLQAWLEVRAFPTRNGLSVFFRDVSTRRAAEEALRESEERFRLLVEGVRDYALFALDPEGRITSWNTGAERLNGWKAEEIIGQHFSRFYPPEELPSDKPMRELRTAVEMGRYEEEGYRVRKDGTRFWANVVITPLWDAAGSLRGFAKVTRDVTVRRATEQALRESEQRYRLLASELDQRVRERTAQLAETNRELESFSYSVSHDLRAPLRGIDGFCEAVEEDEESTLSPAARGYLARVRRASARMGQLIDDLLRLSRLSRLELRREPVDLTALAHAVVAELAARGPERGVEVRIQPDLRLDADPRLVRVLLENLLGNAWKFTQRVERPRIELSATPREGRTLYCVRDNGVGFDMKYADKLFGPFQRLHEARDFPGTGIGLATVQRVVHRHGGQIWAESVPGQGAAFFFSLEPLAPEGGFV
ncbi:MAG TPA: PAS domain S-box protein [Archangium sp.]|uniref:PAS domain S-box protein n=1 Tax=Archangium sp. TaxID=1872627 RepID=UPI002EDA5FB9